MEGKVKGKMYQDWGNHGLIPSRKELVVKLSQDRDRDREQVSGIQDCFLPQLAGIHRARLFEVYLLLLDGVKFNI